MALALYGVQTCQAQSMNHHVQPSIRRFVRSCNCLLVSLLWPHSDMLLQDYQESGEGTR